MLITLNGRPPVQAQIDAAEPGRAALASGETAALADITALAVPDSLRTIDGTASIGLVNTGGNTQVSSLRLDGNLTARAGDHRYTATAAITRADDQGVESARSWSTGIKYDRFVTPKLFLNANTILTSDQFRDLQLRTALGAGVGYQVIDAPRVTLTADTGLGFVNENLGGQPGDRYAAGRESATLSVFLLPDRVELFHEHDTYVGVTGTDNLFVKTQNGVRFMLAAGFITTIRHDLDSDRSPAAGRRQTDRTFAVTLGYSF